MNFNLGALGHNKLTVVTPAYYEDLSGCPYLFQSCKELGLNLHVYGIGEPWPWLYEAKVKRLRREIEKLDTEYVLVSDSGDAFFLAGEEEILAKFHLTQSVVLISGEKNCWPQPKLAEFYIRSINSPVPSAWRYVNSGGYLGTKWAVLDVLKGMEHVQEDFVGFQRDRDWMNDQFRLSVFYLQTAGLAVDDVCSIFQTMGNTRWTELCWSEPSGRVLNAVTGNYPCHLHFNGHAPGIKEAFERRFASCNAPAITA